MVQDLDFFFTMAQDLYRFFWLQKFFFFTIAQDLYNFFQNNNFSRMAQDLDFF